MFSKSANPLDLPQKAAIRALFKKGQIRRSENLFTPLLKALEKEKKEVDAKNMSESCNEVSTCCEGDHRKEFEQLQKEHSEIEEELQQWVEDGDQKNKALQEIIETTNDENAKLLFQISVTKKELKALESENKTLKTELKTNRIFQLNEV